MLQHTNVWWDGDEMVTYFNKSLFIFIFEGIFNNMII